MDEALLSTSPAGRGQLVKMLITLEPHGIWIKVCILIYCMQNEASVSTLFASRGILVKMLITLLEPHGIF